MQNQPPSSKSAEALAPTARGGPPPKTSEGPPEQGKEAGLQDEGKRLRPKFNYIHHYARQVDQVQNSVGNPKIQKSLVDYPDSPGSGVSNPVLDLASPVGGSGPACQDQTPEQTGRNAPDPDFPNFSGQDLSSGLGKRRRSLGPDSGFKSLKSFKGNSPATSPDMFLNSSPGLSLSPDPNAATDVGSGTDPDIIPSSLTRTNSLSRIPILRLTRLSSSSSSLFPETLGDNGPDSQVGFGRKRKGSRTALSSSSSSGASDLDERTGSRFGMESIESSETEREDESKMEIEGARGTKTKPEALPKGKGKPRLSPLDLNNGSLIDFQIPKITKKSTKLEFRQVSILQNFEKAHKPNYKNDKITKITSRGTEGRGRRPGSSGARSRSGSARSRPPREGTSYSDLMKYGFGITKAPKAVKNPPPPPTTSLDPFGSSRRGFPPSPAGQVPQGTSWASRQLKE